MRLQQYEDGTFGYFGIDGDEYYNFMTESLVVCTQGENEDRDTFIKNNHIEFTKDKYGCDRYGSNEKLDKLILSDDYQTLLSIIEQRYGLDKLMYNEQLAIRGPIIQTGYALDVFVNDPMPNMRRLVAIQGYGLDILVNDEFPTVRREVAKHGYGLNILVKDKDWPTRAEVAKHEYGLGKLICDPNYDVRTVVYSVIRRAKSLTANQIWIVLNFGLTYLLINHSDYELTEEQLAITKSHDNKKLLDLVIELNNRFG